MKKKAHRVDWLAVLLVVTAVTVILLITLGVFDPRPVGTLQRELPLSPQTIAAKGQSIVWLDEGTPAQNYSLRLETTHQSGETDVLYGLVIGSEADFWVTAVSPLGYAAIWEIHSAFSLQYFPFQPWPHVRPDANEIWLDVVDGHVSVRLNRELLWQGEVDTAAGQIGLWLESFGETAVIDFQTLQIFTAQETEKE